jgi:hypothetical protein
MKNALTWGMFLALSASAQAAGLAAPQSPTELCSRPADHALQLAQNTDNLFDFGNEGGTWGTALCWWHSRLQRASLYLAVYNSSAPKPTADQVEKILAALSTGNAVVTIPGYRNFKEFSRDWKQTIVDYLSWWELSNATTRFTWLTHGLRSVRTSTARSLQAEMDKIYNYVTLQKKVAYVMLQMRGIMAHAWLVIAMDRTATGYKLRYIDSNYQDEVLTYEFRQGQRFVVADVLANIDAAPYLLEEDELERQLSSVRAYCRR